MPVVLSAPQAAGYCLPGKVNACLGEGQGKGNLALILWENSCVKKSRETLNFEFNKMGRCNRLRLGKETVKLHWGPSEVEERFLLPSSPWIAGLEFSKPLKDSVWLVTLPRAEKEALLWKGLESISKPILLFLFNNYSLRVCLCF